ncbi:hypothetical protein CAC42_4520 [Sphaceloma murrayae]|uniref:RING-type domain-containing protein n=1 Tax=Sphaceloma murrayae TaxID=2082308 RepID=A0A2K1QMK3_9PEZI|nr:hypothetical protein CAC42_4520 [Sphaceloma murrayae]
MAANVITDPAVIELANSLAPGDIPVKLRCATCSKLAFNAFKIPCCDQSICDKCQASLPDTCPVCMHSPLDPASCTPNKSLRLTVKAYLKSEEKKRAKESAPVKTAEVVPVGTPVLATPVEHASEAVDALVQISVPSSAAEDIPTVEAGAEHPAEQQPTANADRDEQPDLEAVHAQQEAVNEDDADAVPQEGVEEQTEGNAETQDNQNANWQPTQGLNSMQMGMPTAGFGNFTGMMGMPSMAMGMPNMFGGFGAMGMGDMSAMNMGMGMGNYGNWNGQQGFGGNFGFYPNGGYNQPYGNQMRQYANQGYNNRFRGQGPYRSRGRGFRGRGNFNQRFQNYDYQQEWNANGGYDANGGFDQANGQYQQGEQGYDQAGGSQNGVQNGNHEDQKGGEASVAPQESAEVPIDDEHAVNGEGAETFLVNAEGSQGGEMQNGSVNQHLEQVGQDMPDPPRQVSPPPLNAPTGPKAMLERRSRGASSVQPRQEERRGSTAVSETRSHGTYRDQHQLDVEMHEERSRASSRERKDRHDRRRSRSPRSEEDSVRRRERKRRHEDKYGDEYHRSSKSSRHGRSRSRTPEDDYDRRSSRHEKDKHRSTRSRRDRDDHESSRDRQKRKERSRYEDREDRGSDRDRERRRHDRHHDRDDEYGRRKHRSDEKHRSTANDDSDNEIHVHGRRDADSDADREKETMRISFADRVEGHKSRQREEEKSTRRSSNRGSDDLFKRIEATRRAKHTDRKQSTAAEEQADDVGFKIKGSRSRSDAAEQTQVPTGPKHRDREDHRERNRTVSGESKVEPPAAASVDAYAQDREAYRRVREEKEQKRRQSATVGKRGREDEFAPPTGPKADSRKRGRVRYEGDLDEERTRRVERDRESERWV